MRITILGFYDHCENHPRPVRCLATGKVLHEDDLYIRLENWSFLDPDVADDFEGRDSSVVWVILKSTIFYRKDVPCRPC